MFNSNRIILFALLSAVAAAITGCTVGPEYERPLTAADTDDGFVNASGGWADANDIIEAQTWWRHFGDPVVEKLVLTALKNNTDLKAAAARVVEYRAIVAQARGVRLPDVSYSANRFRSKISFNPPSGLVSFLTTVYSQELSISYIGDFFGKLKRSEQAAWADLLATEQNRQALVHTIIAQVVGARTQIASLQRLLEIARANTQSWRSTLEIVERRYNAGLVGPLDVHLARENLAASEAAEPVLERSVALAMHALDVLLGQRAATSGMLPGTLGDVDSLSPVPPIMPAALLDRRPDIRAAEAQLVGATERIGVSIAEMFPDMTFSVAGGYSSGNFRMMSATENEVYSAIISLAAPVFKGGQLKARVNASKARAEQAAANYAGVVLQALREVEDALVSEQMLQKQLGKLQQRQEQAYKAEELARRRYSRGVERLLIVLETQRRRRIAENEVVAVENELWQNRINLFLALGGDWDVPSDAIAQINNSGNNR